jgi:arylsulfatase A
MDRRSFLGVLGVSGMFMSSDIATSLGGGKESESSSGGSKYNIVFIMADDLGANDIGCYGRKDINTPNIDLLAQEGMMFNTCFSTPVCAPSRILVMTGRYGFHTKHFNMGDRPGGPDSYASKLDFTETELTFANILKDEGYSTALAGKWQLVPPSFNKIPQAGFEDHMVWQISYKEGFGSKERIPGGEFGNPGSRYFHPSISHNGIVLKTREEDFGPDMFCNFIQDFMQRNADLGKPFLAYYPMCLPHRPIGPTPDHPDQPIDNSEKALVYSIEYLDKIVGRIVRKIEELGIREKTVIFFTGDNGTETRGKNTPTEAGCRVPLVVSCPGLVKKGSVSNALIDFSDMSVTIAELAGAELPKNRVYDGRSFLSVLTGKSSSVRDWAFSYMGQFRILRTDEWLLENECADYRGDFYHCGSSRDGTGYKNVTDSNQPDVLAARRYFDEILVSLPGPDLPASERHRFLDYLENYNGPDYDISRARPGDK